MQKIKASIFKANCIHLMDEINKTSEEIIITKNGRSLMLAFMSTVVVLVQLTNMPVQFPAPNGDFFQHSNDEQLSAEFGCLSSIDFF